MRPQNNEAESNLLGDLAGLLGASLPLLQLFFDKLPATVSDLFLSSQYFTSVSAITLLVGYIAIIAYRSQPYFRWVYPGFRTRQALWDEHYRKVNEAQTARNQLTDSNRAKVEKFIKSLDSNLPKPVPVVSGDNLMSYCVAVVVAASLGFVTIGQLFLDSRGWGAVQSVLYIAIVVAAGIALSIFSNRRVNQKRWDAEQRGKNSSAMELAVQANSFGTVPQLKFVGAYSEGFAGNYHVFVDYKGKRYEIVTDAGAKTLVSALPVRKA